MVPTAPASLGKKKKSTAWAPTQKSKSVGSFSHIQSEDLARKLDEEENSKFMETQTQ